MKAVVKDKPGPGISVKQMAEPEPKADEVILAVKRASICGSDIGLYNYTKAYAGFAKLPIIPGHEFAGEVAKIGSAVTDFKTGDRVVAESIISCGKCRFCRSGQPNICLDFKILGIHVNGGFSERAAVPVRHLHRLSDKVDFDEAALIEPLAVVCHGINDVSGMEAGDFVTIIGPGPIGLLAAQVARANGAQLLIVGIDADQNRLELARRIGFTVLNSSKESAQARVLEQTDNIGADLVVVAAGAGEALASAAEIVRKGGRILNVAIFPTTVELNATSLVRRQVSLYGTFASIWANYEQAMDMTAAGRVDLKKLVTHVFRVDEALSAFEAAKMREGCKVQISF